MAELTIIIDSLGNQDLKRHLMKLKGIIEVNIKQEEQIEVYMKYNHNLISSENIKKEVSAF